MHQNALKARPRRRKLPSDTGLRVINTIAPNILDRQFHAAQPNRKWIADFTYIWTAEGWLYVAAVIDLFSRRVVGSLSVIALQSPFGRWVNECYDDGQNCNGCFSWPSGRAANLRRCCITLIKAVNIHLNSSGN